MARDYIVGNMYETRQELDEKLRGLFKEVTLVVGERAARLFGESLGGTEFLSRIAGNGVKCNDYPLNDTEQDLVNFGTALVENNGKVADELFDILVPYYTGNELVILVTFAGQLTAANLFYTVFELSADDTGY
jgi:hypothetical protein